MSDKTQKYILLGKHWNGKKMLKKGGPIHLTETQAANLTNKVELAPATQKAAANLINKVELDPATQKATANLINKVELDPATQKATAK